MLAFVLLAIATMIAISLNEGVKEEHGDFSNLGYMVIGVMTFLASMAFLSLSSSCQIRRKDEIL